MKQLAIYVGRLNPIHLGHEAVISEMVRRFGMENCLLVLGSASHEQSIRHFFSYDERKNLIKKLFPELKIVPLSDFPTDQEWLNALDDLIHTAFHLIPEKSIVFFGGCIEDISFFEEDGREVEIMNRFDGTTPSVSATEVRDALISNRPLEGLLNPIIAEDVLNLFQQKWEMFKKK